MTFEPDQNAIWAFRLVLAALLAAVAGIERRGSAHPAGMRTHMLISIGGCLLMIASLEVPQMLPDYKGDPGRIAAQVVSGIGFLGAGAILRLGVSIRGLTTAASLWLTAAIGLTVGAGLYFPAVVAAVLLYFTLVTVGKWEKGLLGKLHFYKIRVRAEGGTEQIQKIQNVLRSKKVHLERTAFKHNKKKNTVDFIAYIGIKTDETLFEVQRSIESVEEVQLVQLGTG